MSKPLIGHLIAGQPYCDNGQRQPLYNPATGAVCGEVLLAQSATVERAIDAAQSAYPAWRDTPPLKRARVMFALKALLEAHADELCELITDQHGKVLHDALGELQRGIENIEYAAGAPELLKGDYSRNVGANIDSWSDMQPLGVVAGITPFNFPAMVPLWMWPLAVVCGNCFILKPSERDPAVALRIAELAQQAGLPPGVLNVVNGGREVVEQLLDDHRIKAVSFVGSTPIAASIYARGSAAGKRVQALGGAKNHAVIMPDADLDNAVSALMGAAFGSCGERCMAISVAVAVGDATADALVARLRTAMAELRIGSGRDNSNDMGPLISAEHRDKVIGYLQTGVEQGAELVVDGRDAQLPAAGYFLGASLFDRVDASMSIYRDEIFGPVLCLLRVPDLAAAMQLIDDHQYGNGTAIFTRDGEAARYFCDNISVGMVGVNVPLPVPVAYHSFGGWKRSLFGDLSAYGPDGVRFYTQRKTVTQRGPSSGVRDGISYSFPS